MIAGNAGTDALRCVRKMSGPTEEGIILELFVVYAYCPREVCIGGGVATKICRHDTLGLI